ncbi:transcriptional regulator [Nocardia neocaledoniensis NBRC 108232]|uniref:MarR family transcriptional regulator n=1 Tax=Nocardia neocaledoniensis TaxID=236511 RepID=A0A317N1U6_9NOCA|nr:MarR family transcriptional regulator [Nocardia neocaledoniensis]PWV66906.1 MarR family transcriptional regulator [Nocardia neocaledoniensis]GEM34718.1 transcriptional regulator [Nocardia neocaledoniensis NBRC 108232]
MDRPATLLKLLVQATDSYERALDERLRAALGGDLRPAHYAVFRHLEPAGSRVTALADAAGMTQQSMGELVTHLERSGYVERRSDPVDRRARLVVATAAGIEALAVAAAHIRRIEAALAAELGGTTLDEMRAALARVPGVLTALSGVGER